MITEDYVSFETAKLLKEKGFDGKCYKVWVYYTSSTPMLWAAQTFVEGETIVDRESVESAECTWNTIYGNSENKNHGYLAPTLQMAMKWLRNEKGIAIIPIIHSVLDYEKFLWDIKIVVAKTNETFSQGWIYENPENGYDRAIRYCLENLI